MPGKGCKGGGKGGRKHTPVVSKAQRGAMGVALAAKREGVKKVKPGGVAKEMMGGMTEKELESHLRESRGKKLPAKAKKKG